ncbi:MAG: 50S ribosomal protein L32 [Chloroflexota bacterium]|nr:50S ribosomal protein L32 [Chloroflexota bacterium]MDE2885485.1 50S ribosomal protein L32 [Chloroflexota bacterium]
MPPLPKRKRSKSRVGTNRAHQHISLVGLVECPRCREAMKPHHACPSCGYYRGRDVLRVDSGLE